MLASTHHHSPTSGAHIVDKLANKERADFASSELSGDLEHVRDKLLFPLE